MIDTAKEQDLRFLAAAIRLGSTGQGEARPNPAVGAILVRNGVVVGRGRTGRGGRPHAERAALDMAGEKARGSTLYVSLEPCAHHGKTPPCSIAIINAGVERVVAAVGDPDKRVSGAGFAELREAGIVVTEPVLEESALESHAGHFSLIEHGRPFITLKLAVSADDGIGLIGAPNTQITGPIAQLQVQALRTRFDAIMVGSGTAIVDDPRLTVRLPGLQDRSPVRVVLDSLERLPLSSHLLSDGVAPTLRFSADSTSAAGDGMADRESNCFETIRVGTDATGLDLSAVFDEIARRKLGRVFVEGGAKVARALLEADCVDSALIFRSPRELGDKRVPALAGLSMDEIEKSARFVQVSERNMGPDTMSHFKRSQ